MSAAAAPAKKAAAKPKAASGPSYVDMIKAAIAAHPEEARAGLSRPTIKKYLHSKYPQTQKVSESAFNNHVGKAIAKGAETKVFTLPKGISGKVKLAKVEKPKVAKKPKTAAAKKPKTATVKKTPATKAKKPATATAAKKTKSTTATKAKKPAAKKTAAAKPAAKKAAAPKTKKVAAKKA